MRLGIASLWNYLDIRRWVSGVEDFRGRYASGYLKNPWRLPEGTKAGRDLTALWMCDIQFVRVMGDADCAVARPSVAYVCSSSSVDSAEHVGLEWWGGIAFRDCVDDTRGGTS